MGPDAVVMPFDTRNLLSSMGPSLAALRCRRCADHRRLTAPTRELYSARFTTLPSGSGVLAPVAELVDALDSKSSSARSAGSIPARGTTEFIPVNFGPPL